MRVGLMIYGDLAIRTGGFLYDRMVAEQLRAEEHEVCLFAIPWRRYSQHLFDNLSHAVPQWLIHTHPDVLVQDELMHPSLFMLNRRLRRSYSGPIISIVHHLRSSERSSPPLARIYSMIERVYLDSVDGFIFNSKATRRSVHDMAGGSVPGIVAYPGRDHIHPVVSAENVEARANPSEPVRLLFVGGITRRKGLDILLRALSKIDPRCWQLAVVGDATIAPRYSTAAKRKAQRLNLTGSITWHGQLSDEDLSRLWAHSHVLVVPSQYEGFGIVYLEAMANGLVPIAGAAGGARELIDDGRNGFLINPGDVSRLRARIQCLIDDRDAISRMGLAGMQRYREHPTWDESFEEIRSFLVERIEA
jgi:glycosyltransferase involved in cell wall biosynthesis